MAGNFLSSHIFYIMKYILFFITVFILSNLHAQTGLVNYGEVQSMEMGAPIGPDYKAMLVFDKDNSLEVSS